MLAANFRRFVVSTVLANDNWNDSSRTGVFGVLSKCVSFVNCKVMSNFQSANFPVDMLDPICIGSESAWKCWPELGPVSLAQRLASGHSPNIAF